MSTVAERLRQAREGQGLSLHQVAELTKIKTDHIRALEEGNYDIFPAPVYVRGSVRSYGSLLKLNLADLMLQLDTELSSTERFKEAPSLYGGPPGPMDRLMFLLSRVRWNVFLPVAGVVLAIFIATLLVRSWKRQRNVDPLSRLGPGLYQPPATGELLPLPVLTNAPRR